MKALSYKTNIGDWTNTDAPELYRTFSRFNTELQSMGAATVRRFTTTTASIVQRRLPKLCSHAGNPLSTFFDSPFFLNIIGCGPHGRQRRACAQRVGPHRQAEGSASRRPQVQVWRANDARPHYRRRHKSHGRQILRRLCNSQYPRTNKRGQPHKMKIPPGS